MHTGTEASCTLGNAQNVQATKSGKHSHKSLLQMRQSIDQCALESHEQSLFASGVQLFAYLFAFLFPFKVLFLAPQSQFVFITFLDLLFVFL